MNLNLLRKTIGDRWRSMGVYLGALIAYMIMVCAVFQTFQGKSGFQEFIDEYYPESMMRLLGVESFNISSFNDYNVAQFLGLMFVIIVAAFIFSFARDMVAGELKDGTLELLLAQPIKRWEVLTSKGAVLIIGIVFLVGGTVVGTFIIGAAFGIDINHTGYLYFILSGSALFIAVAGYSVLLSAFTRYPRRAVMAAAGVTLAFYLVHFAAAYSTVMEKIDILSIFHYYNPLVVLNGGGVPFRDTLVLIGTGLASFLVAIIVFRKKDITG